MGPKELVGLIPRIWGHIYAFISSYLQGLVKLNRATCGVTSILALPVPFNPKNLRSKKTAPLTGLWYSRRV